MLLVQDLLLRTSPRSCLPQQKLPLLLFIQSKVCFFVSLFLSFFFSTCLANIRDATFLDLPPVEVARQLTLKEFTLYQQISDRQVLMWDAGKDIDENFDPQVSCPDVWLLLDHNEWLAKLVVSLVVSQDGKSAAKMVEHLVFIAEQLRTLNNFNGCRAVMEGLLHPQVAGLEGVWVSISSRAAKMFDALKDFVEELKTFYKNQQWMQKVSAPGT